MYQSPYKLEERINQFIEIRTRHTSDIPA